MWHFVKQSYKPSILLTLLFIISRYLYIVHANVRLSTDTINYYWQYLDPVLLKSELLKSLIYLHQQPPLYNLYLGAMLKFDFLSLEARFHALALCMGFLYMHCLYQLMLAISVKPKIALALTIAHTVAPTTLLYEHWLFYTYPIGLMMCACALFLARFLATYCLRYGFFFFSIFAALVLTRNLVHFELFILVSLLLYYLSPPEVRRSVLISAAVPLAIVLLFTIKQLYIFGTPWSSTTYLVPNLVERTNRFMPSGLKQELLKSKKVPNFYFTPAFRRIDGFRGEIPDYTATGIRALDQNVKSTGAPNFNHIGFFTLTEEYSKGLRYVLLNYPEVYLQSLSLSGIYFWPASDDWYLAGKPRQFGDSFTSIQNFYDKFILLRFKGQKISVLLAIGLPVLLVFGLCKTSRCCIRSTRAIAQWFPLAFMLFWIISMAVVTLLISWGDFNRYRVEINSYYLVLFGLLLSTLRIPRISQKVHSNCCYNLVNKLHVF